MQYTFIYPSDYFDNKVVDESHSAEFNALKKSGFKTILYTDSNRKSLRIQGDICIYRGWMLSEHEYSNLEDFINASGAKMLTSKDEYFKAHYMPNWYDVLADLTPDTFVIEKNKLSDIKEIAKNTGWSRFFVKDYVKSLTTKEGSIANSIDDVIDIASKIETFRTIEGGICLREVHDFVESSEIRYFVLNGKISSPQKITIPKIAKEVASRISLPFFSIDIIKDINNKEWLVEIGDGQVSSFKEPWDLQGIVNFFKSTS